MLAPNPDVEAVIGGPAGWFARHRRTLVIAAILILAAGGAAYWWLARQNAGTVEYRTAAVGRGDLTVTVSATGTVQPINEVEIGSELSGVVRSVEVDFNDRVSAGQLLATLDAGKLEAAVRHSRAARDVARANLAQADVTIRENKLALERVRALIAYDHASQQTLEAAEAAHDRAVAARDSAAAQVELAEADVTANEADLGKTRIVSPIAGIVLERNVEPGQTVNSSLQAAVLFRIAEDLAQMRLVVDVDEADSASVREGDAARFNVEAHQNRSFAASVTQLRFAPKTTNGVVTYEAILSADNADLSLRPGMTATAEITVDKRDGVLLIANAALRYSTVSEPSPFAGGMFSALLSREPAPATPDLPPVPAGDRRIWVLRGEAPAAVIVTPGLTDGSFTEVLAGDIKEGDRVIVDEVKTK